jgi:ParB-like chromosome segregation protein Spo0J
MTNVAKLATANAEGPTFHDYVAHPLAATFPMIEGTPMEELKADIRNHGILEPIRLFQGMILDGRNRYAAGKACGHVFTANDFKEWVGTLAEAEAYVISTNLHRRQLTNAQKQEVIQRMIAKNPTLGDREIARMCGVSHTTVAAARDRLAHSPEVRRYEAFKKDWKKLSDEQCAAFVKDHAADLRFLLAEVGDNLAS